MNNTDKLLLESYAKSEREYEWEWVNGLINQILFADKELKHYHLRLVVKEYCDCWPNCYSTGGSS